MFLHIVSAVWCVSVDTTVLHTFLSALAGHRPVNVKRAVIGSKGGWKISTIFLSCKVFHDWSIIKLGNILYL